MLDRTCKYLGKMQDIDELYIIYKISNTLIL